MLNRSDMVYDFMKALAANPNFMPDPRDTQLSPEEAEMIFDHVFIAASQLAQKYLENS